MKKTNTFISLANEKISENSDGDNQFFHWLSTIAPNLTFKWRFRNSQVISNWY